MPACPNCEESVKESWVHCPSCGANLQKKKFSRDDDPLEGVSKRLKKIEDYLNDQPDDDDEPEPEPEPEPKPKAKKKGVPDGKKKTRPIFG